MKVKFNDLTEFLTELEQRGPNVENVVRVTNLFTASKAVAVLKHVQVVATYLRALPDRVLVVRLERYVGDLWPDHSEKVMEATKEVQAKIEETAKALGLEVRSGVYEE